MDDEDNIAGFCFVAIGDDGATQTEWDVRQDVARGLQDALRHAAAELDEIGVVERLH